MRAFPNRPRNVRNRMSGSPAEPRNKTGSSRETCSVSISDNPGVKSSTRLRFGHDIHKEMKPLWCDLRAGSGKYKYPGETRSESRERILFCKSACQGHACSRKEPSKSRSKIPLDRTLQITHGFGIFEPWCGFWYPELSTSFRNRHQPATQPSLCSFSWRAQVPGLPGGAVPNDWPEHFSKDQSQRTAAFV